MNLFGISRELHRSSPGGLVVKNLPAIKELVGSIPGSGTCPGERNELDMTYRINNNNKRELQFRVCNHGAWVYASYSSHAWFFVTPWSVAHQDPLSMEFHSQDYWSGLPCSSPGDLPNPGTEPTSPELQADSLPLTSSGEPHTSHHMEREREHFHRGEKEAGRDLINKFLPWCFIAESLPGKKRCLFSSYWALLLSQGGRASPSGLLTPLNSGFCLLIFSRSWFERKQQRSIKWLSLKKKNHKMSRTKPVQYKWDQLKDWVAKWLTFERIKGTSPTWLPQSWNMGLLMPSDSNWNTGSAWAYTIDSPGPIAFWLLLLGL